MSARAVQTHVGVIPQSVFLVAAHQPGSGDSDDTRCLRAMQADGIVACDSDLSDSSTWYIQHDALGKLDLLLTLHSPKFVLEVRPELSIVDKTTFELAVCLLDAGWKMRVRPHGRGGKKARAEVLPYGVGSQENKVFYINEKTGSASRVYLQALLTCAVDPERLRDAGVLICHHFQKQAYYDSIANGGKPKVSKRLKRSEMLFRPLGDDLDRVMEAGGDDQSNHDGDPPSGSDDDDSDNDGDSVNPEPDPSSSSSSSSSSSNGSAPPPLPDPSSSSSSSSSSSDDDGDSAPPPSPPPPIPPPSAGSSGDRLAAPVATTRSVDEGTFHWGNCLFTHRAATKAYQCTCYHHSERGSRCTKTLSYHDEESRAHALQALKIWATKALLFTTRDLAADRVNHQGVFGQRGLKIPDEEWLDEKTLECLKEELDGQHLLLPRVKRRRDA